MHDWADRHTAFTTDPKSSEKYARPWQSFSERLCPAVIKPAAPGQLKIHQRLHPGKPRQHRRPKPLAVRKLEVGQIRYPLAQDFHRKCGAYAGLAEVEASKIWGIASIAQTLPGELPAAL
eukprot:scaffold667742_cov47-Prasinocladus_malaysianus.AAC.1